MASDWASKFGWASRGWRKNNFRSIGMFSVFIVACLAGCSAIRSERITISYLDVAEPGFIDQTLTFSNRGSSAQLVVASVTPRDSSGREVDGVIVKSAFGSVEKGMVVPPGEWIDILQFTGTRSGEVVDVKTTVKSVKHLKPYDSVRNRLEVEPEADGSPVEKSEVFDHVRLTNPNSVAVSAKVLCILWQVPNPGESQQAQEVAVIANSLVPANGEAVVPVLQAFSSASSDRGFGCDSLKAEFQDPR